jgi:hypothetical protein
MPYAKQITAMRKATAILVATPGRLIDLLNKNEVQLDQLQITVLDEADQMADMGFLPVVKEILDQAQLDGQRLLFSATLDRGVDSLVRQYLKNPKTHSLQNDRASVSIWIGNGCVIPCAFKAFASAGAIPRSRNEVVTSVSGVASTRFASARLTEM